MSYANFLNAIDTNHDGIITPEEITEYLRNRYPELRDIPFMELIFNKRIKEILARLERMMHDSVVTAINNALQAHQITEAEANNALRELNRLFKFDGKISLTEYLISVHWLGSALADILRDNESLMRWINQNLPGLRDLLNSLPENIRNQVLEYLLEGLSQFFGEDSDCVLFAIITYESSRRNCNKLLSDNDLKDICRQVLDCNDRPAGPTLEELMGEVSPGGGAGGAGMSLSN